MSGERSKRKNPKSGAPFVESLSPKEQRIVRDWWEYIGVPAEAVEGVVIRDGQERYRANLLFFEWVRRQLPHYPWKLFHKTKKGLLA